MRAAPAIFLLMLSAAASAGWQFDGVDRVVAVSDIHGAHASFVETLENAGILDEEAAWRGGEAHLVIVGDILDRGADSRKSMDLLMRLEQEALDAGGRVHVLIGNHEAMNLVGDLRYVAAGEYAAFAGEETDAERERWFEAYLAERAAPEYTREAFDEAYPRGFFAHRRAFAADGRYGSWLLDKPVIVVINGTAFVHGGVSPMIAEFGLEGLNGRLVGEMRRYVSLLDTLYEARILLPTDNFYEQSGLLDAWLAPVDAPAQLLDAVAEAKILHDSRIHDSDGPLWYRGNVSCSPLIEETRLLATLDAIGATRVVIGHTPTPTRRVLQRLDGAVIEVDTGMLAEYYNGSGNVFVIEGDSLYAMQGADGERYAVEPHPRQVGSRPGGFLSLEDTLAILEKGEISKRWVDEEGRLRVTLEAQGRSLDAVFAKAVGRRNNLELAAYRLDRLLGLDMVPATVSREVARDRGSLQFEAPATVDEQQRSAAGGGYGAQCPLTDQWAAMYLFDALIHNEARTQQRMRYDQAQGYQLILVGHDMAFATKKGVPAYLETVEFDVNDGWRRALEALSDEVIERELGDVLDKRRQKALANRRDELLER